MKIQRTQKSSVAAQCAGGALCLAVMSFELLAQFSTQPIELMVNTTYIDMHTAPGRGYPKFYALAKGEHFTVIKQRTNWIKVTTTKGEIGWIKAQYLKDTLTIDGKAAHQSH